MATPAEPAPNMAIFSIPFGCSRRVASFACAGVFEHHGSFPTLDWVVGFLERASVSPKEPKKNEVQGNNTDE